MISVCYKTFAPMVYNKGTKDETSCNRFLAYITPESAEKVQRDVDVLNSTHPEELWNGKKIDWDSIAYFFIEED